MRYLTRSYVEWLGLERVPIAKARSRAVIGWPRFDGTESCLPSAGQPTCVEGVKFNGRLYEREHDGLAYVLLPGVPR